MKTPEGPALLGPRARQVTAVTRVTLHQNRVLTQVLHDLFKLTAADENVPNSQFERRRSLEKVSRVVSVPDRPVLPVKGQPPGGQDCRPPLLRGIFMKIPSVLVPTRRITAAVILLLMVSGRAVGGDTGASSGLPNGTPEEYTSLKRFPQNLGGNFLALFSKKNIAPLLIGGAATGVISIWDKDIQEHMSVKDGSSTVGKVGEVLGSYYVVAPTVGGLLIAGHGSQNDRFHSFTYALAQATVLNEGLVEGLKVAVRRTRPDGSDNYSFPSGHAATSFMAATVVEQYYGWKAGIIGYSVASFISVSRLRKNVHWASDVTAGATLGYIVGSSVCRRTGISLRVGKVTLLPAVDAEHRRFGVFLSTN